MSLKWNWTTYKPVSPFKENIEDCALNLEITEGPYRKDWVQCSLIWNIHQRQTLSMKAILSILLREMLLCTACFKAKHWIPSSHFWQWLIREGELHDFLFGIHTTQAALLNMGFKELTVSQCHSEFSMALCHTHPEHQTHHVLPSSSAVRRGCFYKSVFELHWLFFVQYLITTVTSKCFFIAR